MAERSEENRAQAKAKAEARARARAKARERVRKQRETEKVRPNSLEAAEEAFEEAKATEARKATARKISESDSGRIALYNLELTAPEPEQAPADLRTISEEFSEAAGFDYEDVPEQHTARGAKWMARKEAAAAEPVPALVFKPAGHADMAPYTEATAEGPEERPETDTAVRVPEREGLASKILPMHGDSAALLVKKGIIIISVLIILICVIAMILNGTVGSLRMSPEAAFATAAVPGSGPEAFPDLVSLL